MDIRQQFSGAHWIWKGGISFVYEVHPNIVVKVPKPGDFEREEFRRELKIYEIFSQNPPCPSIVQYFFYADNGIFLEYMRDFDCTAEIGSDFEVCMAPYGRLLNSDEQDQGSRGSSGFLGPRTEQFALGSLYYLINHGFEVYGDRCLTEDRKEHGRKVVDLLQNMEFPKLNGDDPSIDDIILECWHNRYATVGELAAYTEATRSEEDNGRIPHGYGQGTGQYDSADDFSLNKEICQNLDRRGLLHMLSSGEPEKIGFSIEWYRHSQN